MPYYNTCPYCGDHLDPGERCSCRETNQESEQQETADKKEEVKSA